MKKSELKNLIKECVREVIFEEGALRTIVTEVTQGLSTKQPITEQRTPTNNVPEQRSDVRSKIIEAMGKNNTEDPYASVRKRMPNSNLFEGTLPLDEAGGGSGIDIMNIPGIQNWGTIANRIGKKG